MAASRSSVGSLSPRTVLSTIDLNGGESPCQVLNCYSPGALKMLRGALVCRMPTVLPLLRSP